MKTTSKIKLTPLLKSYLKPMFGGESPSLTEDDWKDFKKRYGPRCRRSEHRHLRKSVKKDTGKWPEHLTLEEYLVYQKPNSSAPRYLKELWGQLTPEEQELVKNMNEWAFIFPATFTTQQQFRVACACRLERFFGRKFHTKPDRPKKKQRADEKFGKLVERAMHG